MHPIPNEYLQQGQKSNFQNNSQMWLLQFKSIQGGSNLVSVGEKLFYDTFYL